MPRTLLVVDDSTTIQQAVRHALTGEDWAVTSASTLAEGLDALQSELPDAVLCDSDLGEGDGYGACRAIRETPRGGSIPVILMGGSVSDGVAMAAGASAILTKPFESDELLNTLNSSAEQGTVDLSLGEFETVPEEAFELGTSSFLPGDELGPELSEIEIVDLSEAEEFGDLEVLQDLEPITVPTADAGPREAMAETDAEFAETAEAETAFPGEEEEEPALAESTPGEEPIEWEGEDEAVDARPVAVAEPGFESETDLTAAAAGEDMEESAEAAAVSLEEPFTAEMEAVAPEEEETWAEDTAAGDWAEEDLLADYGPGGEELEAEEETPEAAEERPLEADRGEVAPPEEAFELPEAEPEATAPALKDAIVLGAEDETVAEPAAGPEAQEFDEEFVLDFGSPAEPEAAEEYDLGLDAAPKPEAETVAEEPAAVPFWEAEEESTEEETIAADTFAAEPASPSEQEALDASWREPEPAPAAAKPWHEEVGEPEPLSPDLAATAEEAVREALAKSLSAERLAPVVEAVVERVVWEVVPQLAERLIQETLRKLTEESPPS